MGGVSDIDELVADVFKISSWNPGVFMETNPAALDAITRTTTARNS
jgi:hypothetical protein